MAALGLVTVVAVDITLTAQEAEAKGCQHNSIAFNASQGRCHPDTQSADETAVEEDEEDGLI
jgi:hypothetical protein